MAQVISLAGRVRAAWRALAGAPNWSPSWLAAAGYAPNGDVLLTPEAAAGLSNVYRALSIIAESVAAADCVLVREQPTGGAVPVADHAVARLLKATPFATVEFIAWQTCSTGNGFAEITRSGARPTALRPIATWRVIVEIETDTGAVWYRVLPDPTIGEDAERMVAAPDMVHVLYRASGRHPLLGVGPLDQAAPTFAAALRASGALNATLANATRPRSVLAAPGRINKEIADRLKQDFAEANTATNQGRTVVLGEGLKLETATPGANNEQLQLAELAAMTETGCAVVFGIPTSLLGGDGARQSGTAAIESMRVLVALTLRPFGERFADALEAKLLTADERTAGLEIEFDLVPLLTLPGAETAGMVSALLQCGAVTPNEARNRFLRLSDVPTGDMLRVPSGTIPADNWAAGLTATPSAAAPSAATPAAK